MKATENNKKAQSLKINSAPDLLKSTEDVIFAEAVKKELKATTSIQNRGKYALNIPSRIRTEVGKFALCYGTQSARKSFRLKYAQYEFKRSTLNERKEKIMKDSESREDQFTKLGRLNYINDEVVLKIKDMIIGIRLAEAAISRKIVTSIGTGILKANNPNPLSEFKGNVMLTICGQEAF